MHYPAKTALLTLLLAAGIGSDAHAVECGTALTGSMTLEADLHCTTGYAAFEVFANNVTINLNGHTLSGSGELSGIYMSGYKNLTVMNGSIRGFFAGVNANRTTSLNVKDVLFSDVGTGVTSNAGSEATIEHNQFVRTSEGVSIRNTDVTTSANDNVISNNEFYQSAVEIKLCGDRADSNVISSNLIWKTTDFGIHTIQSDKNKIVNNRILESGLSAIRLVNASHATIEGNTLREGRTGVNVLTSAAESCLARGSQESFKNDVNFNYVVEFETGIELGLGEQGSALVSSNSLLGNKVYDNDVGMYFHTDAHENTTMNGYQGTTTPIVDFGVDNTY